MIGAIAVLMGLASQPTTEPPPGLVVSAGRGILHGSLPPGLEVAQAIRPWTALPDPEDAAQWVIDQVEWMVEDGNDPIMVVGSSKGGAPVMLAVALRPELFSFVSSVVFISSTGGLIWGRKDFPEVYHGDVLQMVGGDERDELIRAMLDVHNRLGLRRVGAESQLNIYDGGSHGFLGSDKGAQIDLRVWTMDHLVGDCDG